MTDPASGGFEWTARNTITLVCGFETDGLIPEMTKVHILLVRDGHAETSRIASRNIPRQFGVQGLTARHWRGARLVVG
ncbi:hypothetical protein [Ensifer adhaerens]|uniref:hypothetical protein n=1 Tax=Ensifer adhaerens TaxID=106592 RepID=UPI001C4DF5D6|nr:hypothetical protein [Ensifer adhaerens]MBW0369536.1 hypothetical protein [Ensifer adhaerens]UCM21351.1 hypothetical protein LDL63_07185 [Ensifer adhaerens]